MTNCCIFIIYYRNQRLLSEHKKQNEEISDLKHTVEQMREQ